MTTVIASGQPNGRHDRQEIRRVIRHAGTFFRLDLADLRLQPPAFGVDHGVISDLLLAQSRLQRLPGRLVDASAEIGVAAVAPRQRIPDCRFQTAHCLPFASIRTRTAPR
ncbi:MULTISPECIES: hypothetical protein [Rhizobium]|uniref:hypothetical protein n=1 Tax=Rhizobium straminoryzae TaxID=1387186 RepID=UPI00163DA6D4|nr:MULTISPECIES: hypothetical protein [Rhizobium]